VKELKAAKGLAWLIFQGRWVGKGLRESLSRQRNIGLRIELRGKINREHLERFNASLTGGKSDLLLQQDNGGSTPAAQKIKIQTAGQAGGLK